MNGDAVTARLALAETLARAAGRHARTFLADRGALVVETKHDALDMVSRADRDCEALIRAGIAAEFPEDGILGEEAGARPGASGVTWVIDPIDGTVPFLVGLPHWCIAIAIQSDAGTEAGAIFQPLTEEMFTARRGAGAWCNGARLAISPETRLTGSLTGIGASHRTTPAHVAEAIRRLMAAGGMFYRNGSGAIMLAAVAAGRLGGITSRTCTPGTASPGSCWCVRPAG